MVPHPRDEQFSVLVVDDHPLLREAIAARLRSMGAGTVYEAASVAEARARAHANGPCDLAILDLDNDDDVHGRRFGDALAEAAAQVLANATLIPLPDQGDLT